MPDADFKFSWRERLRFWLERKFRRQRCDGCEGNFILDRLTPVSGDCSLCEPCFRRWYPEFFEKPDA